MLETHRNYVPDELEEPLPLPCDHEWKVCEWIANKAKISKKSPVKLTLPEELGESLLWVGWGVG